MTWHKLDENILHDKKSCSISRPLHFQFVDAKDCTLYEANLIKTDNGNLELYILNSGTSSSFWNHLLNDGVKVNLLRNLYECIMNKDDVLDLSFCAYDIITNLLNKEFIDSIILHGSSLIRNDPNDYDIAIVVKNLKNTPLR